MRVVVVLMSTVVALWLVSAAMGDNGTTQAGYGGEPAVQVTLVQGSQVAAQQSQNLPFTGLEIGALLAAGVILLVVGFGMRRLARQR